MRKIGLIIICVTMCSFLVTSCICGGAKEEINYTRKCVLDITYENGETDTIYCEFDTINGRDVSLTLKSDDGGNCIAMASYNQYRNIACGVRKFNIISDKQIVHVADGDMK